MEFFIFLSIFQYVTFFFQWFLVIELLCFKKISPSSCYMHIHHIHKCNSDVYIKYMFFFNILIAFVYKHDLQFIEFWTCSQFMLFNPQM
jgi:hypothetical protein